MGYLMKIEDLFSPPSETSLIWTNWREWSRLFMSLGKAFSISVFPAFRHGPLCSKRERKKRCQHKKVPSIILCNVSRGAKTPFQSPLRLVSMWTRGGSRRGMQGTSACSSNRARNKLLSTSPHLCCCHFLTTLILVGTILCWALKMYTVKHLERTKKWR